MVGLGRRRGGGRTKWGNGTLCKTKWRGETGLTRSLEGAGMHAEVTCNAQRQPRVNTGPSHTNAPQKRSTILPLCSLDRRREDGSDTTMDIRKLQETNTSCPT